MHQRAPLAEAVGTFVLVLGGVGSAVLAGDAIQTLGIAIAFGLTLLVMAYAIGPISGCHINPAVTAGLLLTGKIERDQAVRYWIAQVAGAVAASLVIFILIKSKAGGYDLSDEGFGSNGYGSHSAGGYNLLGAIVTEVVLTGLLVFVVLACTDKLAEAAFAGIPIGLTLMLIHLVAIPIDGTSVNPARSIGPALFTGSWALGQLWVFVVFPLVGAVLGATVYRALFGHEQDHPRSTDVGTAANS